MRPLALRRDALPTASERRVDDGVHLLQESADAIVLSTRDGDLHRIAQRKEPAPFIRSVHDGVSALLSCYLRQISEQCLHGAVLTLPSANDCKGATATFRICSLMPT